MADITVLRAGVLRLPIMRVRVLAWAVAVLLLAALVAYTDRAFLTPVTDRPERADAIVVLGGDGHRVAVAKRLAAEGYSSTVVLSVASLRYNCIPSVPGEYTVTCFIPAPFSTQGEARYIAALARSRHWTRILLVSGHAQTLRARLRVERCWSGQVLMVPAAATPLPRRLFDVAYEWGATLKAELWQRGC